MRLPCSLFTASLALLSCATLLVSRLGAQENTAIRAQLTSQRSAVLAAEIGAKVSRLHVQEAGSFKEGDPLVSFDSGIQKAQLDRAQATLSAAEKTCATNRRLLELNSIGKMEMELSEADLAKAKADLSLASTMLAKCTILAPFPGRVSDLKVHELEYVQPGQGVMEVVDATMPQIDFIVPSKWLVWLKLGQSLQVRIDETERSYEATLCRIGAKVDPVSQSIKVVALFTENHPELMSGMSGSISLKPIPSP